MQNKGLRTLSRCSRTRTTLIPIRDVPVTIKDVSRAFLAENRQLPYGLARQQNSSGGLDATELRPLR